MSHHTLTHIVVQKLRNCFRQRKVQALTCKNAESCDSVFHKFRFIPAWQLVLRHLEYQNRKKSCKNMKLWTELMNLFYF